MQNNKLKVLISAYACGPKWGSEIGMGWNWVTHLSNYCELTVITEAHFKEDIEEALPSLRLKFLPTFHFIDIGTTGTRLFWKQGSFKFYFYYRNWQFKAYELAKVLCASNNFDIIHQLNMIGFREPGFLWKINKIPFIWGPVGGFNQFPLRYLRSLNTKSMLYYSIKNFINYIQIMYLIRPKKAARKANQLFASTTESQRKLKKYSSNEPILLNETGCKHVKAVIRHNDSSILKVLWVGKIQGLKALPIALHSLAKLKNRLGFTLTIVGDGPDENINKELASKLGISKNCIWKGRIANEEVINVMRENNLLLFTSLKEGTPHVVMEAIENGLPVICHDACGHGATINEHCGIKVPMKNFKTSISEFSDAIFRVSKDPDLLNRLSSGAVRRAAELTWESKAHLMFQKYMQSISQ